MTHRTLWAILASVVLPAAVGCGDSFVQDKQQPQRGDDPYVWTFDRIEPPETFPPHPRLFLDQQEIDALKAGIAADPAFRELVDTHLAELRPLAKSPALPTRQIGDNLEIAKQAAGFAVAYVLTDEPIFAEAATAILKRYVEVFPGYEPTHLKGLATSAALEECVWAVDATAAYDLIYNSAALTDADKRAIEQTVFRASAEVLRHCNHAVRSNWRIRSVGGIAAMGFAIGDRELIDEALNGIRDDDGRLLRDGFVQHMAWSLLADGIYYERSQSYSEECGDAFAHVLEAARHSGIDLWSRTFEGSPYDAGADADRRFGPSRPKTIRHAYDAVLYRSFGNGTLAKAANSYWDHLSRRDGWSAAWRATGDDRYAWPLVCDPDGWLHDLRDLLFIPPKLPTGSPEFATGAQLGVTGRHENACTLLPNGGHAILRHDAGRDAVSAAITFGDFANGHCQADALSIVVYAGGRHVLPDTKYFRYIDQHLTWSKQTITHNTVTVDELSQYPQGDSDDMWITPTREKPLRGRAVFFHAGDDLKAVRAECNAAYDGVGYDRTIALVDSVVVDFFRCRSEAQHQYDYALHVDGTLADCSAALGEPQPGPLAESYGYRHIVDLRRAAVDDQPIELTHNTDDGAETLLHTTILPAGKVELITGNGIEGLEKERAEVVIIRKRARNADFVSVIAPAAGTDGPLAAGPVDNLPDGVLGAEIAKPDGSKTIVLSAEQSTAFEFDGVTIEGQLALLKTGPDGRTALVDVVK